MENGSEKPENREKVVLVCLQSRSREVYLPTTTDTTYLEKAVRATFSDVTSLTDSCQVIFQVCLAIKVLLCVF